MRRICLILLPLFLSAFLLVLSAFALPPQYTETFLGAFADKIDAFYDATGPRIILAGGSGAAFAVRSDLLEEQMPSWRVINLGMYAGLGSTVPLEVAKNGLREGDIVIFLPEQNPQTLSLYFGAEAMWQAADGRWDLLGDVFLSHGRELLGALPYFAGRKAGYFFSGAAPAGDGIYARSSFTLWGDIKEEPRKRNIMPGGFDPNMPISFLHEPTPAFTQWVNQYAQECSAKGVRFYLHFCPMNAAALDGSDAKTYAATLSKSLCCPLLGEPSGSILDAGWFYDTNFHLNGAGAITYTRTLARLLKEELGLPGEVSIEAPAMPNADGPKAAIGDNSSEDCFLYAKEGEGYRIIALSEKGARQESLTVPVQHEGRPVTAFDPSVFAGDTLLSRITLQSNLSLLPDGAFEGCTSLREIILAGIGPSELTVGKELLRGTTARILVDASSLSAYQTNYFWSLYGARIYPLQQE